MKKGSRDLAAGKVIGVLLNGIAAENSGNVNKENRLRKQKMDFGAEWTGEKPEFRNLRWSR